MRINRTMIVIVAFFVVGVCLGYSTFSSEPRTNIAADPSSPRRPTLVPPPSGNGLSTRTARSPNRREAPPSIKTDQSGNFILPATMVDRLECSPLNGLKANRQDLRVLGLSDGQIDQVQELVDQTIQRCFDREKSVMQEFTTSDDELVGMIPGNTAAAATEKQRLIDAIQLMGGTKTALLEKELVARLANITMEFGEVDSFFRVSRVDKSTENSENRLFFERIQLHLRPGEPAPTPGSSFMGYTKQYQFSSRSRFGGKAPPEETAHLFQDGQWEHLLQPRKQK